MKEHGVTGQVSRWIAAMALVMALPVGAQRAASDQQTLRGVVFVDANGNGRREADELPQEEAKVSNGRDVVLTDAQGRYRLPLRVGDTVFLIKPPERALPRRRDGLPDFWKHHFPRGTPRLRYGGIAAQRIKNGDFAVQRPSPMIKRTPELRVLVFGDPQPKSRAHVDYFARDIVAPLTGHADAMLGLSLGDIVNDDLSLFDGIKQATTRLGLPWLHLPGNHDLDFDVARDEDSLLSYRAAFGPDTYAWEEPEASFVLFDDVIYQPGTAAGYIGGIRPDQFAFLENYLATLPDDRALVLAAHIHLHDAGGRETFRRADRERLFALLSRFTRVLLLTSHAHAQRHYFHTAKDGWKGAEPLHEYVVGTTCGGFWTGLADAQGIPDARMEDGTPNGYARLTVGDDDYRLRWHVARDPGDTRIGLSAPRVLRRGAYPAFVVTANVFMGMDDTRVEYRVDEGEWRPMTRAVRADPALLAINAADDATEKLRSYDRAVEAALSTHLWRGALPTDLAVGEHRVEVRAFDRWDGELRASTSYRLAEFANEP